VISVSPATLAATQAPGTQSVANLTLGNAAAFPLWWNLPVSPSAGCGSAGVSWLSVGRPSGTTDVLSSESVGLTFNSTGLTPGHYSAHVCVQSGDTYSPQIDVPVALTVTCPIGGPLAITASPTVGAGSPGRVASVRPNAGSTFAWTITNGTITSGQGTNAVTFTAGTAGTPVGLGVTETNPDPVVCIGAAGSASIPVLPAGSSLLFFPVTPCRLADTRLAVGPLGGPALAPSEVRLLKATNSCNIPSGALGVSMNVTVTQPAASGFLAAYPGTATYPGTSTLSFRAGQTRADATVIGLATDGSGTFRILNGSAGTAHVIVDLNGYFY
jgi:PKD-like domain